MRGLGIVSGAAIVLLSIAYGAVTIAGLAALAAPRDPIGDPWFSAMEMLILLLAPAMLGLMAATHAMAAGDARAFTRASLASMAIAMGLTCSLHLSILLLGHDPFLPGRPPFLWPSLSYFLDIAAWDVFFALSLLLAAPAFASAGLEKAIRLLLLASGVLAFAGLAGPITGDMRLRAIGILGYAAVFPVAAGLMTLAFLRRRAG